MKMRTARAALDRALAYATRQTGVTAETLQEITGWARCPTAHEIELIATRNGYKLERLTTKAGDIAYRFIAPTRQPDGTWK